MANMFTFEELKAARVVEYRTDGREWRFRRVHGLPLKAMQDLAKRIEEMTAAQVLAELAAVEGLEVTAEEIEAELSDTEIEALSEAVASRLSLGE